LLPSDPLFRVGSISAMKHSVMARQHNDSSNENRRASSHPTSLPQETFVTYIAIIDDIIARSDMDRVNEKQIRQTLEKRLGIDLLSQKVCSHVAY